MSYLSKVLAIGRNLHLTGIPFRFMKPHIHDSKMDVVGGTTALLDEVAVAMHTIDDLVHIAVIITLDDIRSRIPITSLHPLVLNTVHLRDAVAGHINLHTYIHIASTQVSKQHQDTTNI